MPRRAPIHRPYGASQRQRTVADDAGYAERQAFINSSLWRKTSKRHLRRHPLCHYCRLRGIIRAATCVDHFVAIQDGGERLDPANFRSSCDDCHASKTAAEMSARARGQPGKLRPMCTGLDGWPVHWDKPVSMP